MPGCSAVYCSNSSEKGFLMKRFPKDPARRKQWQVKTRRVNWKASDNSCLCEVHFTADMWEKTREDGTRRLKWNAVPTVFAFSEKNIPRKPPTERYLQEETTPLLHGMGGCRCSYKNCTNSTKNTENITFFHYPVKQKQRCKTWIENACKPEFLNLEEEQLRNKVICQNHFLDKWFPNTQKKRLLQGAIPTLDVGCDDELVYMRDEEEYAEDAMENEREMQHGQAQQKHYKVDSINLVPVSDDNTVFILDTNPLMDSRNKVESYTYRNGDLVRSQVGPRHTYRRQPALMTPLSPVTGAMKREAAEPITLNPVVSPTTTVYHHPPSHQTAMTQQEFVHVKQESYETESQEEGEVEYQMEEDQENELKPIIRQSPKHANLKSSSILPAAPPPPKRQREHEKDYLKQLRQHSKDIAEIKRMLKQQEQNKMDVSTAVNFLRERLPSTFFTVLCLNMDCKSELSDEDIEFFTTLHKTSPEMYQILIDKYKWNLPSVNVVEAD